MYAVYRKIGFVLGPMLFLIVLLSPYWPEALSGEARGVVAVALLMGVWWVSDAIPIPATSIIPMAAFPLLGVMSMKDVAAPYANPAIFLFAGGFFIAMAMQKWDLHERIALHILLIMGARPSRLVLGFMIATAFLSMWISNTATAIMMVPIGIGVTQEVARHQPEDMAGRFGTATMLGIAYAASIGGIATLVGTPPNIAFKGFMETQYPDAPEIGFGQWMLVGVPLMLVMLPVTWFLLTRVLFSLHRMEDIRGGARIVEERLTALGPPSRGEWSVLIVSATAAVSWIFRPDLQLGFVTLPGWGNLLPQSAYIHDGSVAIFFAVVLFALPVNWKEGEFALDWEWARRIPWGILLLFGGGLALAKGFSDTGLVAWLGGQLEILSGLPLILVVMAIALLMTFTTEVTSNTATTNIMLPILAATAAYSLDVPPLLLLVPATISASCAFMLPVATPPNAIVFGSGSVTIPEMVRAGFVINLIGVIVVTLLTFLVAVPVFGISL
jgi:sodium-dependent dicarboxylate transporter 2/3/5